MKRRLALLRHAKSSWSSGASADHARPLNERGRRTAPLVGEWLAREGWAPDHVLSSDSLRTRMTVEGVLEGLGRPVPTTFTGLLYHAGVDAVRRTVPELPEAHGTVLLVGHNPGWESVCAWLCGEGHGFRTGDCALLEGHGATWEEAVADPGAWTLRNFLRSRSLLA